MTFESRVTYLKRPWPESSLRTRRWIECRYARHIFLPALGSGSEIPFFPLRKSLGPER